MNLGYGVLVNAGNLNLISRQDPKKTTYTMCEVLFTRAELASSSLTGKRSNTFKELEVKGKLDEAKVQAVIGEFFFNNLLYATVMLYCTTHSMYSREYKTVRVRVSVYSLPDDGVRASILNDSDYVYIQGNGTTPPGP